MLLLALACYDPLYGEALNDTQPDLIVEDPTHDVDIQPIWDSGCAGCHTNGGVTEDLSLDDGFAATVEVTATQVDSMVLVSTDGDPDSSYLWLKLQGTHADAGGSGTAMPPTGSLDEVAMQNVQNWLEDGAPQ